MFESVLSHLEPFAREFSRRGKQIYLVGGAVRNLVLGRPAQDFDFTTDALPEEVQSYFRKVLPTGLKHGTVTVLFQGEAYEVTTFRVDGAYADGRRPDSVVFTPSLEEDLRRRDFTVNALALDLADGRLVDPHDGQGDLKRQLLRAIGDPGQRFDEDALRLLRLFRFASQLGFAIEPETLAAVGPRRARLASVSHERIRQELAKALAGSRPDLAWRPLQELGFLQDLFAGLKVTCLPDQVLQRLPQVPTELRWSFWLTLACGADREACDSALRALTFSNADREAFLGPARALSFLDSRDSAEVTAKAVIEAWGARERAGTGLAYLRLLETEGYWRDARGLCEAVGRVAAGSEPVFVGELAVGGRDLLSAGVPAGPEIGRTLKRLQREVWANPGLNSKQALLERAKALR